MNGWQEKEVYNISDTVISEVQSARCPHCKKILTTPYLYYFDEFPFCPSCGKRVSDKPTNEIKREAMRNVKKIEKAMQMELEGLKTRIMKTKCPHNYGMKDMSPPTVMCTGHCEECWNEEVENDKT